MDNNIEIKKRGRKPKYSTDEERREARLASKRNSNKKYWPKYYEAHHEELLHKIAQYKRNKKLQNENLI